MLLRKTEDIFCVYTAEPVFKNEWMLKVKQTDLTHELPVEADRPADEL